MGLVGTAQSVSGPELSRPLPGPTLALKSGTLEDLGTLGGRTSWANHLNGAGQVVGQAAISTATFRGALFDEGSAKDLCHDEVGASGAFAINERGQIVGFFSPLRGARRLASSKGAN